MVPWVYFDAVAKNSAVSTVRSGENGSRRAAARKLRLLPIDQPKLSYHLSFDEPNPCAF